MKDFPPRKDVQALHRMRVQGEITREEYWGNFRELMLEIALFSKLQEAFTNEVTISEGRIRVKIPTSTKHENTIEMYLNPDDLRSMPFIGLSEGYYESLLANILLELGSNSKVFVDIGANTGFYSVALAATNPNLKIFAFEPQPQVFDSLIENLNLNDLGSRVVTHNIGVGSKDHSLTMFIPAFTGTVGGSFMNLHRDEGEAREILVPVRTLDSLEISDIDLIKIDVEGYEQFVLDGAQSTLHLRKPTIVVELLRKWMKPFNTNPQGFLELMKKNGYFAYAVGEVSIREIDSINEETNETNFIFCHPESKHLEIVSTYQ